MKCNLFNALACEGLDHLTIAVRFSPLAIGSCCPRRQHSSSADWSGSGSMDLVSYLEDLPTERLGSLYDSPYTCQAVLRSLPPLGKQYVLRMLFLDAGIPEGAPRMKWPRGRRGEATCIAARAPPATQPAAQCAPAAPPLRYPAHTGVVASWVQPSAESKHNAALSKLQRLQILTALPGGWVRWAGQQGQKLCCAPHCTRV